MSAPKMGFDDGKLVPFFTVGADGRKQYRKIDDELLAAFEADVQAPGFDGMASIGMLCARIRASEAERDTGAALHLRETEARLAEANEQISKWGQLVDEVKQLADKLKVQFAEATKAGAITKAATLLEVAALCRRDARGCHRRDAQVLLAVADAMQQIATMPGPSLTREEIEAALDQGKKDAGSPLPVWGGFIPS